MNGVLLTFVSWRTAQGTHCGFRTAELTSALERLFLLWWVGSPCSLPPEPPAILLHLSLSSWPVAFAVLGPVRPVCYQKEMGTEGHRSKLTQARDGGCESSLALVHLCFPGLGG